MALTDLLNTLRGFGEGATVGAIKYPQAALLAQVMDIPYSEALKKNNITATRSMANKIA